METINIRELTAEYICGIGEESASAEEVIDQRLRMALHVYEAMPTVRHYLIKGIFKDVGERIAENTEGVDLWRPGSYEGVIFQTNETDDYWVFAETYKQRQVSRLVAGVYVAEPTSIKNEHRERFKSRVDLESWSDLERSFPSDRNVHHINAFVRPEYGGGRWDDDVFLTRAILKRNDIVSRVEDILKRIYEGMFPLPKVEFESSI